ncbi:hypothetical protein TEA_018333 [Camellia sinensis var. sinensis]|uniref:Ubiquitin thioesterase OTU n=1 Tax=Camellia sinensis var. sinensis TaxID=542762 RepID=A0A4S4EMB5_CAMSN|nr:hypothetical protein TEA_018333 [Camellia sinensis var. sinensis]
MDSLSSNSFPLQFFQYRVTSLTHLSDSVPTRFSAITLIDFSLESDRLCGASPAMKKLERYAVQKVTGDGRCLFRALVKGMAFNKGIALNPREERENAANTCETGTQPHEAARQLTMAHTADELRMAVKEVLCDNDKERLQYEEALVAITVEESLKRYCQRIGRPDFWGGESELLHTKGGWGSGFIPIAEYGTEFRKGSRKGKSRKVVRLVYSGKNHYDLLV